jgi:hypothetical protein
MEPARVEADSSAARTTWVVREGWSEGHEMFDHGMGSFWFTDREGYMDSTSQKCGHGYSFKGFSLFLKTIFYIVE